MEGCDKGRELCTSSRLILQLPGSLNGCWHLLSPGGGRSRGNVGPRHGRGLGIWKSRRRVAAQDAIESSLAHPATRNSTPRHPTDLMCHHPAPGDPRALIPGHIPTGNSPISPTSSLSTSMRVRDTPAISSAVMKDPTKARAMRTPRLSAGSGSEAGEFQSGQSQGMGSQAPPCTHPGSAQQLQPQFPAPGRTIHPGCSPRAPRRILQDGWQDETGIRGIWGSTEGLGGLTRGQGHVGSIGWISHVLQHRLHGLIRRQHLEGTRSRGRAERGDLVTGDLGMGRKQQNSPLTFILRTPASPWIPTETGPCHIPTLVTPPQGGQGHSDPPGIRGGCEGAAPHPAPAPSRPQPAGRRAWIPGCCRETG